MSAVFKPPAPPRKRTRLDVVPLSVSRSPTALFAAAATNPTRHHYTAHVTPATASTQHTNHTSHSRSTGVVGQPSSLPTSSSAAAGDHSVGRSVEPRILSSSVPSPLPLPLPLPLPQPLSAAVGASGGTLTSVASFGCLDGIRHLVVPSSSAWSTRSWWIGRRVLVPSFIFPQSRSTALHCLLSALRCVVLDDWYDGAVDLCVVDEEDAVREVRANIRNNAVPAANTIPPLPLPLPPQLLVPLPLSIPPSLPLPLLPPPPATVSSALTLSTTLSHLDKAVRESVPVLSLSSILSSSGLLLLPIKPSNQQPAHPTITLSSLSDSHAPFSRSFAVDGSGLPSQPLLWLTAPKHCSPFIRPRKTRGRQLQQQQQEREGRDRPHTLSAAEKCRQQAEEAEREKAAERNGRHTCEVCGVQFNGVVDAHISESTHQRKQREQNWQPLVQLAQQLNMRRHTFDTQWSEQQRNSHSTARPASAADEADEGSIDAMVSNSVSDSSSNSTAIADGSSSVGSSGVQRSPSGLCLWYSSHPPPARCFANWYADDVLWSALPHQHRTLAVSNYTHLRAQHNHTSHNRDTLTPVQHNQTTDNAEKRSTEATGEHHSAMRPVRSRQLVLGQSDVVEADGDMSGDMSGEQRQQAVGAGEQRGASGEWSRTHSMEQPTATQRIISANSAFTIPQPAASIASADNALPGQLNASPPAVLDSQRDDDSGVPAVGAVEGAGREMKQRRKKRTRPAASFRESMDGQTRLKQQLATQSTQLDTQAAHRQSDSAPTSDTQPSADSGNNSRTVKCKHATSDQPTAPKQQSTNSVNDSDEERISLAGREAGCTASDAQSHSLRQSHVHNEGSSGAIDENGERLPALVTPYTMSETAQLPFSAANTTVTVKRQQRRPFSRLDRELVRLAEDSEQWVRSGLDEMQYRTRGGRSHATTRAAAAAAAVDSRGAETAVDGAILSYQSSLSSPSRWFDELHLRVTRTSAKRAGQSGDDLLADAAQLDGNDLSHYMLYQCRRKHKQRSQVKCARLPRHSFPAG